MEEGGTCQVSSMVSDQSSDVEAVVDVPARTIVEVRVLPLVVDVHEVPVVYFQVDDSPLVV